MLWFFPAPSVLVACGALIMEPMANTKAKNFTKESAPRCRLLGCDPGSRVPVMEERVVWAVLYSVFPRMSQAEELL